MVTFFEREAVSVAPDLIGAELFVGETGGIIVVSNHISNFDPVALGHFLIWHGRWPRTLAKSELWQVPVIGWLAAALLPCAILPRNGSIKFRNRR